MAPVATAGHGLVDQERHVVPPQNYFHDWHIIKLLQNAPQA